MSFQLFLGLIVSLAIVSPAIYLGCSYLEMRMDYAVPIQVAFVFSIGVALALVLVRLFIF